MVSPNAELKPTLKPSGDTQGNAGVYTYSVTLPTGETIPVVFGPCSQAHADNLASMLGDGGFLASKDAGNLEPDGIVA